MLVRFLQTFLARVIAAWIAALAGFLLTKYGIEFSSEDQKLLVEHIVGIILPVMLTAYAVIHKLISKQTNPGDTASGHLAEAQATEASRLQRLDELSRKNV